MKQLGFLIAGTLAFWAVVAYPARLLWGDSALLFSATAGLLCLVPTVLTLAWYLKAFHGAPETQLLAALGGTAMRMVVVVGIGMILFHTVPELHYQRFWLWLLAFYLFTLTVEITLIARHAVTGQVQKN
jgi:hypothetical protein